MSEHPHSGGGQARVLPARPNLDHLKNQAKSLLKQMRRRDPAAQLAKAQLALARDYGFASWPRLHAYVLEQSPQPAGILATVNERAYEQAKPRRQVGVDRTILERCAGTYRFWSCHAATITPLERHLQIKYSGLPPMPIYPESATKFFHPVAQTQISFVIGGDGRAGALIRHEHGFESCAPRVADSEAAAAEQRLAERIGRRAPIPGSADALRNRIELALQFARNPDAVVLPPDMPEPLRYGVAGLASVIPGFGALRELRFQGVGRLGFDNFEAEFEHAAVTFRVLMGDAGELLSFTLDWEP